MIGWAGEALAASALLMLLVLGLRGPASRMFGAEVAYLLWALPTLRLLLPPLPAGWSEAARPIAAAGARVTVFVLPAASVPPVASPLPWLAIPWLAGAALFLGWQVAAYRRDRLRIFAASEVIARHGRVSVVASAAVESPVAFGVFRPTIVVPRDWEARFDATDRALALAHERAHHARGDLLANWAALLVLALHWFNPVAWRAYRAFRSDQEGATDARVLREIGASPRAYARCLVAATAGPWLSPACHLTTLSDLKRRLRMLTRPLPTRRRVYAGIVGTTAVAVAALGLTASGGRAAPAPDAASPKPGDKAQVTYMDSNGRITVGPPDDRYPVYMDPNGKITVGHASDEYPAHSPAPPTPPAAPTPPVPPLADRGTGERTRTLVVRNGRIVTDRTRLDPEVQRMVADVQETKKRYCGAGIGDQRAPAFHTTSDGRRFLILCGALPAQSGQSAPELALNSPTLERDALANARRNVATARRSIETERNLTGAQRAEALAGLARAQAELAEDGARAE